MVRKLVSIAGELGRPIATPEETRQILKLAPLAATTLVSRSSE
jgi:uncharacterized protein (DUF849 family)